MYGTNTGMRFVNLLDIVRRLGALLGVRQPCLWQLPASNSLSGEKVLRCVLLLLLLFVLSIF